jgi:hypothetical protein
LCGVPVVICCDHNSDVGLIMDLLNLFVVGNGKCVNITDNKSSDPFFSSFFIKKKKVASTCLINKLIKYMTHSSISILGLSLTVCDYIKLKENIDMIRSYWCVYNVKTDEIFVPNSKCLYTLVTFKKPSSLSSLSSSSSIFKKVKESKSFSTVLIDYKSSQHMKTIINACKLSDSSLYQYESVGSKESSKNSEKLKILISSLFYYDVINMVHEIARKAVVVHGMVRNVWKNKSKDFFKIPHVTRRMFAHSCKQTSIIPTFLSIPPISQTLSHSPSTPITQYSQNLSLSPSSSSSSLLSLSYNITVIKVEAETLKKNLTSFKKFLKVFGLNVGDADVIMVCSISMILKI